MREWDIGGAANKSGTLLTTDFLKGPVGVLTTTTKKAGTGLMNTPVAAEDGGTGFVGMTGKPENGSRSYYNPNPATTGEAITNSTFPTYPGQAATWDFTADDHYPELKVFSQAEAAGQWGDERTAALVRAYSKASTAGPQLETWDKQVDTDTGKLTVDMNTANTYDTARDIVSGFLLTSKKISKWDRIGFADSNGTTGMTTAIAGASYPVLDLKYQNSQYLCDELTCGIEWLKVSAEDKYTDAAGTEQTVTATRRVRVIPTCAINAGESAVITGKEYDHADDVALLYSTAARMAKGPVGGDTYDVTTGIFPDCSDITQPAGLSGSNALTARQIELMEHGRALSGAADINALFATENDGFSGVLASFMQKDAAIADNTKDSVLYTYLYEVTGIAANGKIETAERPVILNTVNENDSGVFSPTWELELNGYTPLPNADKQYLLTYVWQLKDGRSLMDAKLVRTAEVPFNLELSVYKDSITASNLYTGHVSAYAGTVTDTDNMTLASSAAASATVGAYVDAAAAWKPANAGDTIKSITLTLEFSGKPYSYSATVDNPEVGDDISVNFVVYRIVYRNTGYYTIAEHVNRVYTLQEADGMYYLLFDKARSTAVKTYDADGNETGREVTLDDVENDIQVDVVYEQAPVTPPASGMPNVAVTKSSAHSISGESNRITYTLEAKNSGDDTAYGVRVKDYVPEGTLFSGVDGAGKYGVQGEKEYVSWFIASLAPGASREMSFTVTVDDCVSDGTIIYNAGLFETTGSAENKKPDTEDPVKTTNTVGDDALRAQGYAVSAILTKVDSADQSTPLSGARFNLYRVSEGGAAKLMGVYSTDQNGRIFVRELDSGSYYWQEISPPAAYKLDDTKHSFTVTDGKTAGVTVTNTRSDVPEWLNGIDHYAYIIGYPEGDVRPAANITRAEVATMFFRLLTDEVRDKYMTKANSYPDVDETDWFCRAVSTMSAMGIVSGYPDGSFNPNGYITRAEFAAIAARFDQNGNTTTACFSDIYEHWGMKEISIAANNGWVLGYEDGTFRPDQLIGRAEAMAMTNRVLQRVPEFASDLLSDMVQWPDNADASAWYCLYVQEATNSHYFARKTNGYETWTELRPVRDWAALER